MAKKKIDFGLILSLGLLIAVGGYWFVKELPVDGIEYYVDLLGEKLVRLVPKEKEKQEVAQIYADFSNKVKEKKIKPENIEQIAAAIINLSNTNDTLSLAEAEKLMQMAAEDISAPSKVPNIANLPETTAQEWENLNKRLSSVHQLDRQLKEHEVKISDASTIKYRVDKDLNVIIDTRVRPELEKEEVFRRLEKEKRLIWMDNMDEQLNKSLERLELQLQTLSKNKAINEDLIKAMVLTQPYIEQADVFVDSLIRITNINWDSIESKVRLELEEKRNKIQRAKASVQSEQKDQKNRN